MINGMIGRPGAGKSYSLVAYALREAERGRQVFANFELHHWRPEVDARIWFFEPQQLFDLPPGLIVIDEAHLWFPARMALQLPPSWLAGMSQTRKRGWDLMWAAQHEMRVDRVVRDVSSWLYLCSAWLSSNGHPLLFAQDCYEPENFRRPGKRFSRSWRFYDQKIANAYNTFETLTVATHARRDDDPYAKSGQAAGAARPARGAGGSGRRNGSPLEAVL